MGRKRDIRRIESIARESGMSYEERRESGDYVEDCKREGQRGSGPRGDYTYPELRQLVAEFRAENR